MNSYTHEHVHDVHAHAHAHAHVHVHVMLLSCVCVVHVVDNVQDSRSPCSVSLGLYSLFVAANDGALPKHAGGEVRCAVPETNVHLNGLEALISISSRVTSSIGELGSPEKTPATW